MKLVLRVALIVTAFCCIWGAPLSGQQLVFEFVNPSFGGSPFNGDWLLSQAQIQNGFTAPSAETDFDYFDDPLEDFEDSINRQVLNQISRELFRDLFGEEGLKDGKYEFGSYTIDISRTTEGVSISILDLNSGGETSLIIPYF